MPVDNTIALQVEQPDAMKTLSSMLNMGKQQLDLQKARETYGADIAKNKAESDQAVGMVQPTIDTATAGAKTADEQAQQQHLATMRDHFQNGAQKVMQMYGTGATANDVKNVMTDTLTNAGAHPDAIKQAIAGIPQDPKDIDHFIAQTGLAASGIVNQIDKKFPSPRILNNGQVQTPVADGNQELTGIVPGKVQGLGIQNQITPAEQSTFSNDSQGRQVVTTKDPRTAEITNVTGAPVNGQSQKLSVLPQDETAQSRQDLINKRTSINDAAAQVPSQHYNNEQIKTILNQKGSFAATGSNANLIKKLGGLIGNPLGEDQASNINKINHYLALQTQSTEQAMGVHTDAGQKLAGNASGSSDQDPASLKTTININDASQSALDHYRRGNEAAIKNGNDVFAQRDYQNLWAKTYGRDGNYAMRYMNAGQTHDKEEIATIDNELGGRKSPRFQSMLFTARQLDSLSKTGSLKDVGKK